MRANSTTLVGICAVLLALCQATSSHAQTQSLAQINAQMLQSIPITKMQTADLDGDDHTDVVGLRFDSSGAGQDRVVIQRQVPAAASGPVRFETTQVLPAILPQDIAVADIDDDGDLDLLVVQDSAADALMIWTNLGNQQLGSTGVFRRSAERFALDLASAVRTLKLSSSNSNRRDVLLVGSLGRPSLLYDTIRLSATSISFQLVQTIAHPGAIAASIGDLDGDGDDDVVIYGTSTQILINQGTATEPMVAISAPALAGIGTVFAASLRDLDSDEDLDLILGSSSGDLVFRHDGLNLNGEPQFVLSQSLGAGTPGVSRGYAWIDADGDNVDDLIAARTVGSSPAVSGGSLVYHRSGLNFTTTPIQRLTVAETLSAAPLTFNTAPHLWLASLHPELNDIWRSELSPPMVPVASLTPPARPFGASAYFVGNQVGAPIDVIPATREVTSLQMALMGDPVVPFSISLPPGINHSLAPVNIPDGADVRIWHIDLNQVVPTSAATIGSSNSITVISMPDISGAGGLACYVTCLFLGLCELPDDSNSTDRGSGSQGIGNRGTGSGLLMGTADEVTLLQRLRDERLSASSGGSYYIDLYQSLQFDLYQATFIDPTFYLDLWQLKIGWMPAIADLVDGNGSLVISEAMRDQLLAVLLRFETHGSVALQQAIARERTALRLSDLAGQPIGVLQQRWEASPLFADSFD